MKKPVNQKYLMHDIILQFPEVNPETLIEKYLETTISASLISKLKGLYIGYINSKEEYKILTKIASKRLSEVIEFQKKFNFKEDI